MARRNVSPTRVRMPMDGAGPDERDLIIKKLKEELIIARGKQKQILLLQNYLVELVEKNKFISEDTRRKDNDIKIRMEASHKMINDLKREVQILKGELRNYNVELGQKQTDYIDLKRHLAKRTTDLDKIRKEGIFLKEQNQNLMVDHANFISRYEDMDSQIRRIEATNRNYENKISQINSKIAEVKAFIGELNDETRIIKEKLRKYEQDNNNISDNLMTKQQNIDNLERKFSEELDKTKAQVDEFIEFEHRNDRTLTEIKHKINLLKSENQKAVEISTILQKNEKLINTMKKENSSIYDEIKQLQLVNSDYEQQNDRLEQDREKCEIHLQNLLRFNSQIQEELEKYLREDEHVMAVIRKKRILPATGQYVQLRESRKNTDRTNYR